MTSVREKQCIYPVERDSVLCLEKWIGVPTPFPDSPCRCWNWRMKSSADVLLHRWCRAFWDPFALASGCHLQETKVLDINRFPIEETTAFFPPQNNHLIITFLHNVWIFYFCPPLIWRCENIFSSFILILYLKLLCSKTVDFRPIYVKISAAQALFTLCLS